MLAWLQDGFLVGISIQNFKLLGPRSLGTEAAAPTPTLQAVQGMHQRQPHCPQAGWEATIPSVHGGTRLATTALSLSTHRNGCPAAYASIPQGTEGSRRRTWHTTAVYGGG